MGPTSFFCPLAEWGCVWCTLFKLFDSISRLFDRIVWLCNGIDRLCDGIWFFFVNLSKWLIIRSSMNDYSVIYRWLFSHIWMIIGWLFDGIGRLFDGIDGLFDDIALLFDSITWLFDSITWYLTYLNSPINKFHQIILYTYE